MLSLKPSKPAAADASQPDLEAVRRQVSAQQALSREVSEPAVIVAASDDQLKRLMPGDSNSTDPPGHQEQASSTPAVPQQYPSSTPVAAPEYHSTPADGGGTLPEENADAAVGIVKQPSSMAKRFGFLSSLRRGSTAAEGSSAISAQVEAEIPQDSPQDQLEQSEGAVMAKPDVSEGGSIPVPAVEPTSRALGAPQGTALGLQQGPTLGPDRGLHADLQLVSAAPIELPPVFEYGSEGEEAQDGQVSPPMTIPPPSPPPPPLCPHLLLLIHNFGISFLKPQA